MLTLGHSLSAENKGLCWDLQSWDIGFCVFMTLQEQGHENSFYSHLFSHYETNILARIFIRELPCVSYHNFTVLCRDQW